MAAAPKKTVKKTAAKTSTVGRFRTSISKSYSQTTKDLKPYLKNGWVFTLILGVLLAAQLSLLANAQFGVYVNAAAFLALVGLALWRESARQLAISAAILPVATMVCLSFPPGTDRYLLLVIYYDVILVLALIYRYMFTLEQPLSLSRLTVKGYALVLPLMLVIGQLLGTLGYLMLRHKYAFDHQISLALVAASSVVFAFSEEHLFRGLIQQRGSLELHPVTAAVLATLLFAVASIGLGSSLVALFALICGAVLSATYYFKQNLVLTVTINAMSKLTYIALLATFILN